MNKNTSIFAEMLYESERTRTLILPFAQMDKSFDMTAAYRVQYANVERAVAEGRTVSGKKVAASSKELQGKLGLDEPFYGHLFASMDCPDGVCDTAWLISPKVEAEIAFVLGEDITGRSVTSEDVRKATSYVVPAIEVVDCRGVDWSFNPVESVADNALSGGYLLGDGRFDVDAVDLADVKTRLYKNDEIVREGRGANVLGDPLLSVAWLAGKLCEHGSALRKGEVVLSGALAMPVPAIKGDEFVADFGDFGRVRARFM